MTNVWKKLGKIAENAFPRVLGEGIKGWQRERKIRMDIQIKEQRIEANRLKNQKLELQNEKYRLQIEALKKKLR